MRIVLDTNVLVAALLNRSGQPARSVEIAIQENMLLLSQSLLRELIEVLERPYFAARIDARDRAAFSLELARVAHLVEPNETIRACRDPKDDRFLEVAVAGKADFIVSGDGDLLSLDSFRGVRILKPSEFLALYAQGNR